MGDALWRGQVYRLLDGPDLLIRSKGTNCRANRCGGCTESLAKLGSESTVRHIALYRGAASIRDELTGGASRSPALAVRSGSPLALNCHLAGASPAHGGARNRAASSAQAELSVREAAVRVQYVDTWPQRRRARGSARRQHTIVVVHIREVPGEVRFWMPAPACEGRAGRCKERRRTPRVLGNACESLLDLRTTQNVATLQRLPEAGPPT
jgi:hypothetical protein